MPGDTLVLEVVAGPNNIATVTDSSAGALTDVHCDSIDISTTSTILPGSCSGSSGKFHQMRAIYSSPSFVKLPLEFTNAGTIVITVNIFTRLVYDLCSVKMAFNPLPEDKILDWSKLKQLADDI